MIIRTEGNILRFLDAEENEIYAVQKGGPDGEKFVRDLAARMRASLQPRVFPMVAGQTYLCDGEITDELREIAREVGCKIVAGLSESE